MSTTPDTTAKADAISQPLWVQKIFDFVVEKHEIPRLGNAPYYRMPVSTGLGALHTTEGGTIGGAIAAMEAGLQKGSDVMKQAPPAHV